MTDQPEPRQPPAERLAEIMAWHGMARYAEPDVLAPYARPAPPPDADGGEDGDAALRG